MIFSFVALDRLIDGFDRFNCFINPNGKSGCPGDQVTSINKELTLKEVDKKENTIKLKFNNRDVTKTSTDCP